MTPFVPGKRKVAAYFNDGDSTFWIEEGGQDQRERLAKAVAIARDAFLAAYGLKLQRPKAPLCERCKRPIPDSADPRKIYCSARCKRAAYRQRKKEAKP